MTDININFFKNRRLNLAKDMEDNSVLLLNSSSTILRNNDTTFPFRQDSNFYYLTGFEEPDSIMLLMSSGESILFCREKNPDLEKWDGFMFGLEGAKQEFHFDKTFDIKLADELIPTLIQGLSNLYSLIGKDTLFDNKLISWMSKANSMERHQENITFLEQDNLERKNWTDQAMKAISLGTGQQLPTRTDLQKDHDSHSHAAMAIWLGIALDAIPDILNILPPGLGNTDLRTVFKKSLAISAILPKAAPTFSGIPLKKLPIPSNTFLTASAIN